MNRQTSAAQQARSPEERPDGGRRNQAAARDALSPLAVRVYGEYREMPGLRLTVRQAARLFGVPLDVADAVLLELRGAALLVRSDKGAFFIEW